MMQKAQKLAPPVAPMDDKSRITEHISNLSHENPLIRQMAAEYIGLLAEQYTADFVIVCGALPELMKCINDENPRVVEKVCWALSRIAAHGGADAVISDGFAEQLYAIVESSLRKRIERDKAAMALGYMLTLCS